MVVSSRLASSLADMVDGGSSTLRAVTRMAAATTPSEKELHVTE
jgi:hypothetical protein